MAELQANFELLPRKTLDAEFSLVPRSNIDATFEINIATKGDKGDKGDTGPAGKDATINGINTVELDTEYGITYTQTGNKITISGKEITDVLDGISAVIPPQASEQNPLADRKYVQDSLPTVNNATLVIKTNGTQVAQFTANSDTNTTANIIVPTKASDVGALPNTTTINDLTTQAQQNALNSGITSSAVSQITANKNNISSEVTNRQNADNNLQQQIDAITASSDVTDIVGTYAELQAYDTSSLPPNSIIKVLQDESRDDETTYYRWVVTGGTGTWVLIGEEGPYYTKGEADGKFVPQTRTVNGKALSNNISLDASDVHALPDSTVIPTVNDGTLTIQQNGTAVETFTANSSTNKTANIIVPTKTSDLNNDSGFITSAALSGYATEQWVVGQGYLTGITSSMVTTALGFTPIQMSDATFTIYRGE